MNSDVEILDFDDCYDYQNYYKYIEYKKVELMDLKNVNRYCEKDNLDSIYNRINKVGQSMITFIGSGNYHYITYLLLENIHKPFTLILFDHHTDMMEPPDSNIISCGSWVLNSLEKIENLKKVIILGVDEKLIDTIPKKVSDKVVCYTENYFKTDNNLRDIIENEIVSNYVYISIDKDVLAENYAVTNWDQGTMTLSQVIDIIKSVSLNHKICGMDICGEYSVNPIDGLYQDVQTAINKNNKANLLILKEIEKI